jgi:hypothetical protein
MNAYLRRLKESQEEINAMDRKDSIGRKDSAGAWLNPIKNSSLTTEERKQIITKPQQQTHNNAQVQWILTG